MLNHVKLEIIVLLELMLKLNVLQENISNTPYKVHVTNALQAFIVLKLILQLNSFVLLVIIAQLELKHQSLVLLEHMGQEKA